MKRRRMSFRKRVLRGNRKTRRMNRKINRYRMARGGIRL